MRRIGFIGWCLLASGCGTSSESGAPLAEERQAVISSGPFVISEPSSDDYSVGPPRVVCATGDICLVAWGQGSEIVLRRTVQGEPAGFGVLRPTYPSGASSFAFAAGEGEFLFAWSDPDLALRAARVRASDGEILDGDSIDLGDELGSVEGVVYAGGRYAVCFNSMSSDELRCLRIEDGQRLDPESIVVGTSPTWYDHTYARGPGSEIAIAADGNLFRANLDSGAVGSPVAFVGYGPRGGAGLSFDGSNYVLVWSNGSVTRAARVRASDGMRLDPPDDIAQLPGGRTIFPVNVSSIVSYDNGSNTVVMFDRRPPTGILLPANLVRPNASQNQGDFDLLGVTGGFSASVAGDAGLLVYGSGPVGYPTSIRSQILRPAAGAVPTVSDGPRLSFAPITHSLPGAGSDGRDFLVVFSEGGNVGYVRVDGQTGERLGPSQIVRGVGTFWLPPVVTWTGTSYVAVWDSRYGMAFGACGGADSLSLLSAIACGESGCARIGASNAAVAISKADPSTGAAISEAVTVNDDGAGTTRVALAVASRPTAADTRYLVFWSTGIAVRYRIYDGNLAPVTEPISLAAATSSLLNLAVASDGTSFLLGWTDASLDLKTVFVDAAGVAGTTVERGVIDYYGFSLGYDGTSFLLNRVSGNVSLLTRMDASGTPLEADVPTPLPWIASSPFGRSLITTIEDSHETMSRLVHGYFYDNPEGLGERAPSPCSPPDPGGGAGGSGGNAAVGGAAGNGGTGATGTDGGTGATGADGGTGATAGDGGAGAASAGGSAGSPAGSAGAPGGTSGSAGTAAGSGGDGASGGTDMTAGEDGMGDAGAENGATGGQSNAGTSGGAGRPSAGSAGDGAQAGASSSEGGSGGGLGRSGNGGVVGAGTSNGGASAAVTSTPKGDSGCSCRTGGGPSSHEQALSLMVGLVALGGLSRRRRRDLEV